MSNARHKRAATLDIVDKTIGLEVGGLDPIFAAIAARSATLEELIAAVQAHDTLREALPAEAKRRPYVMTDGSAAFDHTQIDDLIDAKIEQLLEKLGTFFDATQLEDMRADRHAKLDAELEAVAKLQREFGYTAVKDRFDAAHAADTQALHSICRTVPTTLRGVATLAGWVNEKFEDLASLDNGDALAECLANMKQAVREFASRAPRIAKGRGPK